MKYLLAVLLLVTSSLAQAVNFDEEPFWCYDLPNANPKRVIVLSADRVRGVMGTYRGAVMYYETERIEPMMWIFEDNYTRIMFFLESTGDAMLLNRNVFERCRRSK